MPAWRPDASYTGNPLLDMVIQMLGPQIMPKGMDFGQWQPNQNIMDTRRAREFSSGQMQSIMDIGAPEAAKGFQDFIMGTQPGGGLVGMGLLTPKIGQEASAFAQTADFGRMMGAAMPFLGTMMPGDVLDELGMGGGQAAANYSEMLRNRMQIPDMPGTGMNQQQLRAATSQITAQMGELRPEETRGFRKGRVSGLVRAAQDMGVGPADYLNMSKEQRHEFGRSISHSASAVRDLGGPFAALPPTQMLQTLDVMTMGGFGRGVDNDVLEHQVRMFKQLSQRANISAGEALGLQQAAGMRAVELGGDVLQGVGAGQHAMAFGAYAKDKGQGLIRAAGVSASELMQQDALLTVQAGQSESGNMASALMRMGETGMLRKGSQAFKAYTNLKDKGEFNITEPGQFRNLMRGSGVNMTDALTMLQQRNENRRLYGAEVAGAVRETQWDADVGDFMSRAVANQLGTRGHMGARRAMQLGQGVTDVIRDTAGQSQEEVREAVIKRLNKMGLRGSRAESAATVAMGAAGEAAISRGYRGGAGHAAALHSKEMLGSIRQTTEEAEAAAAEDQKHAAEAQEGPVGRIMRGVGEADDAGKLLARFFGGYDRDRKAMRGDRAGNEPAKENPLQNDAPTRPGQGGSGVTPVEITNWGDMWKDAGNAGGDVHGVAAQPMGAGA